MSTCPTLAQRLRDETRDLHTRAERSGVMAALLAGRLERARYAALLRNLHPIYAALEHALDTRRADPRVAPLRQPALYRQAALEADLAVLHGADWADALPLATAAAAYAERIRGLAAAGSPALVAHAYLRYLGDLHGGQVLARQVQRSLRLTGAAGTAFYRFGPATAIAGHRAALRDALAGLPLARDEADAVVGEARWGFEQHVRLFEELAAA